jgi:hypothetical protein
MKNSTLFAACIFLLTIALSCKNEPKTPETSKNAVVGTAQFEKKSGQDCDLPDTARVSCVEIRLKWPVLKEGNEPLKKSTTDWANAYLVGILMPEMNSNRADSVSIETAASAFAKMHEEFVKESEGSVMGLWTAESHDTVLLNDGKYLTLRIEGYTYAGGAHGSPTAAVATFDVPTGKRLNWDDFVTDKAALKTLAEKKFRAERSDAFNEGFEFDETFVFELPANYGLVSNGIYCQYLPYEVGPYALGGTEFVLSFVEIGALSKIKN